MARLQAINPSQATGQTKQLLDTVSGKFGMVPNLIRTLANSPAALEGYGDAEITEVVAVVALMTFSNYFNHVADTEVDFPAVPQLVAN